LIIINELAHYLVVRASAS